MATTSTPMRAFTITFSPRDKRAAQFFETIKMMDFFHVEESPYDPDYVAMVKGMDKRTFKTVKREDLWK